MMMMMMKEDGCLSSPARCPWADASGQAIGDDCMPSGLQCHSPHESF